MMQLQVSDQNPEYSSLYDNMEANMETMARDNNPHYILPFQFSGMP